MSEKEQNSQMDVHASRIQCQAENKNSSEKHIVSTEGSNELGRVQYINREKLRSTVLCPSLDANFSILDEEAVLLNLDSGYYYTLNQVGTVIWQLIDGVRTLHDIQQALCDRFEISKEQANNDLISLVDQFCAEGLVNLKQG